MVSKIRALAPSVLDWLYPKKCGLCNALSDEPLCKLCRMELSPNKDGVVRSKGNSPLDWRAAIYFYEGRAKQAVARLKYSRSTTLAKPLAELIAQHAENSGMSEADAIIPVPIHWLRFCQRGFNQAELLCGAFPVEKLKLDWLSRIRATRSQVGLTIEQRRTNLKNAFAASSEVEGKEILLIDDVYTSGGTAEECARALKKEGAKSVGILVLTSGAKKDCD